MNIIEISKEKIGQAVAAAFEKAVAKGELSAGAEADAAQLIQLEIPKDKQHGDFACNIAMLLAKSLRMPPRKIADAIAAEIETGGEIERVEVAGAGFINFYLSNSRLYSVMRAIEEEGSGYGRINIGNGKRVVVEFVSANPTGPMHMGNARGGALGDCMASVLEYAGYDVTREFYVNEAGNQIESSENRLKQDIFSS